MRVQHFKTLQPISTLPDFDGVALDSLGASSGGGEFLPSSSSVSTISFGSPWITARPRRRRSAKEFALREKARLCMLP